MSRVLGLPSSKALLGEVRSLFQHKKIFYALRTHVTFVCGGNKKTDFRPRFLKYVTESKSTIAVFRAEDALNELFVGGNPDFTNLGKLEKLIARIFDSVVIFPESPGSYAELGLFSHDRNIRKRTLVVNADVFQDDSFLNLGPIAAIDQDSIFRSTILLRREKSNPGFDLVVNRLMRGTSKRQHREPFEYRPYRKMSPKDRFFLIGELVSVFGAMHQEGLAECIKKIFGGVGGAELNYFISILCAAQFVARDRRDAAYLVPAPGARRFFEYEHYDINSLQARIAQHYKRHDREAFSMLKRVR